MKSKLPTMLLLLSTVMLQHTVNAVAPPIVNTKLRSIGLGVSIPQIQIGIPAVTESIDVAAFTLSPVVDYSGPQTIAFYPANTTAQGKQDPPLPIATAILNPEWDKTLLIWSKRGENSYGVLAMPDDAFSFPQDHVRFVNITPNRIGIITKEKERTITLPKNHWIIDANGREAIYFRAIMEKPGNQTATLSNVIEMRANVRRTIIFAISNAGEMGASPENSPQFAYFVLTEKEP